LSPFDVVDLLGDLAQELRIALEETVADKEAAARFVCQVASEAPGVGLASGLRKVERYTMPVLAGFVVGDWFNSLSWHSQRRVAA
jgi:hypothetical protein